MKILAIAGRNLASLGSFEVKLDQDPFDREGLFAITGPTGAGKSTILDAMCVALFDRIPRLQDASNRLKLNTEDDNPYTSLSLSDPRQIMRRGAKSCFASTTFTSSDGHRYCARWEILPRVRKSKTLNDPSISLENLDTEQVFSGKKTEVLPLIQEKVGLTFDQFCRSVLLAQGDFAAFLKAGGDARAELLERMTGTEIYAELSVAAFQRSKEEQQKLADLQTQMNARPTLSPDERAALETKRTNQVEELKIIKAAWETQNQRVLGFEKRAALEQALAKANADLDQIKQAWELRAPQREELQRWDVLAKARQLWADRKRLAQEEAKLKNLISNYQEQLEKLGTAVKTQQETLASTQEKRTELDGETEALKPQLDTARKLDHALETTALAKAKLTEEMAIHEKAKAALQAELQALEMEHENLNQRKTSAQNQIDQLHAIEPLVGAWPSTQQQLSRLLEVRQQLLQDARSLTTQLFVNQEQNAQVTSLCQWVANAKQGLASLLQAGKEHSPKEDTTRDAWTKHQQDYLADQKVFAQIRELAKDAARLSQESSRLSAEHTALGARATARQVFITTYQETYPIRKGQLEEAKANLERLLLASSASAELMRSQLIDDQPCPVCGSKDHPFAKDPRFDGVTQAARSRVAELEQEVQSLHLQKKTTDDEAFRDEELGKNLKTQSKSIHANLEQLEAQFTSIHSQKNPSVPHALGSPEMFEALDAWQTDLEKRAADLDASHRELQRQEQQNKIWQASMNLAQERLQRNVLQLQALEHLQRDGKYLADSLEANLDRLGQEAGRLIDSLADLLGEDRQWLASLALGANTYIRSLGEKVAALQSARTSLEASQQLLQQTSAKLDVKRKEKELLETHAQNLITQQQNLDEEWTGLSSNRALVLNGRPVKQVESEHAEKITALRDLWETQRHDLVQTQQRLGETQSLHEQNKTTLQTLSLDLERTVHEFNQELALHGFQQEEILEDLERYAGWATSLRSEIAETKSQLDQAVGAEKGAHDQLQAHCERFSDEGSLEEALEQRTTLQTQRDQWETHLAETRHQLQSDDAAKAHLGSLLKSFEAQAAMTELWGSMKDLIGSSDGKKFRIYAQSLTLEMLLHHANHHLADLARRYRLERLPGTDLALRVIDLDMGDEVRSVSSLSGGETFLVSLALALGLATFTTSQTPIESLFIDEGFGSLDSESLDLALDALEALQAQGRQVGVISHVQTLMERIAAQVQVRKCGGGRSEVQVCFLGN